MPLNSAVFSLLNNNRFILDGTENATKIDSKINLKNQYVVFYITRRKTIITQPTRYTVKRIALLIRVKK